jgi:hypothetical protein
MRRRNPFVVALAGLLLALGSAGAAEAPAGPGVTITLGPRHGQVTPNRHGCTHTGGGNIDVQQPSPDTLVVTLAGVTVATGNPACVSSAFLDFDVDQCFEVVYQGMGVKKAKLSVEGRVVGLLRGGKKGYAAESHGCAAVLCDAVELVSLCVPEHAVAGGEDLSVNDHVGVLTVPVGPGKYSLHQTFRVEAAHPRGVLPCKPASAEFAPDPALEPLWISYREPFHGAVKKDFGFQVTVRVAEDSTNNDKSAEKSPAVGEKTTQAPAVGPFRLELER